MKYFNDYTAFIGILFSYLVGFLGGWDTSLYCLLSIMVIDYITGLFVCCIFKKSEKTNNGSFSSNVGWKGIIKKFCMLLCVYLACRFDELFQVHYIRDGACITIIINELGSVLENFKIMGVDFPKVFLNVLELLKKKGE